MDSHFNESLLNLADEKADIVVNSRSIDLVSAEIKKQTDIENQSTHTPQLYYLDHFNHDELRNLSSQYKKTLYQIEKDIGDWHKLFWAQRIKFYVAIGTNGLFVIYLISTGNEGLRAFIKIFSPETEIPEAFSKWFMGIVSSLNVALYFFIFSAKNEAVLSVLRHIDRGPLLKLPKKVCDFLKNEPGNALKFFLNENMLLLFNLNAIMSEILPIKDYIDPLPGILKWPIIVNILYFGKNYMESYLNDAYYAGLAYLRKLKEFIGEQFREGNYAVLLQIFLQGLIGSAGTSAFPGTFYLAAASVAYFEGFWPPALVLATISGWLALNYSGTLTAKFYLDDNVAIKKILATMVDRNEINSRITHRLMQIRYSNMDKADVELAVRAEFQQEIKKMLSFLERKVMQDYGPCYLLRSEPKVLFPLMYRAMVGGFFGYKVISPIMLLLLDAPLFIAVATILTGAAFFTEPLRRAEMFRVKMKLVRNFLESTEEQKLSEAIPQCRKTTAYIASSAVITATAITNIVSPMGVATRVLGEDSPSIIAILAVVLGENAINSVLFNWKRNFHTFLNFFTCKNPFSCKNKKNSSSAATFFHHQNNPIVKPDNKSSWFCWRRRTQ